MKLRTAKVSHIIVHTADTPPDRDIGVEEIRKWHTDKGWDDIGYHYVIRRDGTTQAGRDIKYEGAHVRGFNAGSIGICLVGGWKGQVDFSRYQWNSLKSLVYRLKKAYPYASVLGHQDFDTGKTCPNFLVAYWWDEAKWLELDHTSGAPEPPLPTTTSEVA